MRELTRYDLIGVCRESKETASDRSDLAKKQGKVDLVLAELPY